MTKMPKFLDDTIEWVKRMSRHKRAVPALAGVSFVESSFFPIPVDLMLIPMVQTTPERAFRLAFIASFFSVLGGIFGYAIGLFLFDLIAQPILEFLGKTDKMAEFSTKIEELGAIGVFGAGLTPFPYKVITIMSGALQINFGVFVIASVLSRSLRFYLVAGLVKYLGPGAEAWIKENFALATVLIFIALAALYFGYRALFPH